MKTVQYLCMNRPTALWNRIESPEIYPSTHGNLVHNNAGISNHWHKDRLSFFSGAGTTS